MRLVPHPAETGRAGLAFGGDYNPEQWPEDVWAEDAGLMRTAGVNLATVGVFSWAHLEPAEGRYEFGWLDRVLDVLGAAGVRVDLATGTASPPPWFSAAYPQTLPVDADGRTLWYGSRQAYCPSSPIYRAAAARLAEALASRYAGHPALALWHVGNEYGCHVPRCYCDVSADAFRRWLRRRHGDDLDALNAAWGTAFWSQRYTDWAQVIPPRATPTFGNPAQSLDFHRFSSDELLACFRAEREVLRRLTPDVPVTTNFITGGLVELDYWAWAGEVDIVSTDHYLPAEDPANEIDLGFAADLARSLGGGRPWLLMEHSTSAVNWQPRNLAKPPGRMRRDALSHVARGSEGAMFFQWRASVAGAEKFHSAMVPHAGPDSRIFREVCALGADLRALAGVAGSTVDRPPVAILLSYESLWAARLPAHPSADLSPFTELKRWYAALWRAGVTADFAHPGADLSEYRLVVAPALYLLDDAGVDNLASYVDGGGTLVAGPFFAVVDEHDQVRPGRTDDLLGVAVEEVLPLPAGGTAALADGTTATVWTESVHLRGASVEVTYAPGPMAGYPGGPLAGAPAITRRRVGTGAAWYLTARLDEPGLDRWLGRVAAAAGVAAAVPGLPPAVDAVARGGHLFLINHGADDVTVGAGGVDVLTGRRHVDRVELAAGSVAVIRGGDA
ncbi:MAG TPA: beta-galactosidase [Micromonosporaceae bacterium]|nr:beta-galactosidase [Micromonosporaceae bacterium]